MFYLFRATTDKLAQHLNRIVAAGDSPWSTHYVGGRDWVILARSRGDDQ